MTIKNLIIAIACTFTNLVIGQTSLINQLNSDGKKAGKWLIYLDKNWKRIEDSTQASFSRITFFENGVNIYPMGPSGGKGCKLEPSQPENKIILLNGEYKWFDAKGNLNSIHVFKNGVYISCKEYFSTGELSQFFDYSKKCEGEEYGWAITSYNKKGGIKHYSITCKNKTGKWPIMRD